VRAEREIHRLVVAVDDLKALLQHIVLQREDHAEQELVGEEEASVFVCRKLKHEMRPVVFGDCKLRILGKAVHRSRVNFAADDRAVMRDSAGVGEQQDRMRVPDLCAGLPDVFLFGLLGINAEQFRALGGNARGQSIVFQYVLQNANLLFLIYFQL